MRSTRRTSLLIVVYAASFWLGTMAIYGQATPSRDVDLKYVTDLRRQSRNKFVSARLTYTVDKQRSQFALLSRSPSDLQKVMRDPVAKARLRSEYVESREQVQVSISGNQISFHTCPMATKPTSQPSPDSRLTFNGKLSMSLVEPADRSAHPSGAIGTDPRFTPEDLIDLQPIVWVFGDLNEVIPKDKSARVRTGSPEARINSHSCVVLDFAGNGISQSFWLDPSQDYSLMRYMQVSNGKVATQCDCQYERSKEGCWIPATWMVTVFFGSDSPDMIARFKMTHYEINPHFADFADDEFDITFPPGTLVRDGRLDANTTALS